MKLQFILNCHRWKSFKYYFCSQYSFCSSLCMIFQIYLMWVFAIFKWRKFPRKSWNKTILYLIMNSAGCICMAIKYPTQMCFFWCLNFITEMNKHVKIWVCLKIKSFLNFLNFQSPSRFGNRTEFNFHHLSSSMKNWCKKYFKNFVPSRNLNGYISLHKKNVWIWIKSSILRWSVWW